MRKYRIVWLLLGSLLPVFNSGCFLTGVPYSMGFATPIPVPAWVTERMEEKYQYDRDHKTVVMPPLRPGQPLPTCEDPPDMATVLRAISRVKRGVPYWCEEFRDNVQVVNELLVDRVDPCRFFPLIGPAQLHHCHWKCIVFYDQTCESGYPFPYQFKRPRVEVVYIDKDHLHLAPGPNEPAMRSITRDTSGP